MKFRNLLLAAAVSGAAYYYRDELKNQWEKWTTPQDSTMDTGSMSTTGTTYNPGGPNL